MNIVNNQATIYHLPLEVSKNMRALIIADLYLDKVLPLAKNLPKITRKITQVILKEKCTSLFILGNLIYMTDESDTNSKSSKLRMIINAFQQIPVPVYILGGNFDRSLLWDMKYDDPSSNIRVIHHLIVGVDIENPGANDPQRVYLAHDIKNNLLLDEGQTGLFVNTIKDQFSEMLNPSNYLLLAHTLRKYENPEKRCASIGAYSLDLSRTCYAVIDLSNGFNIKFTGQ